MTTIAEGNKRLLQLAEHLDSKEHALQEFNFRYICRVDSCGTSGCAMGEMPAIWPKQWAYEVYPDYSKGLADVSPFPPLSLTKVRRAQKALRASLAHQRYRLRRLGSSEKPTHAVIDWFALPANEEAYRVLFEPAAADEGWRSTVPDGKGGYLTQLESDATAAQVAAQIRAYVAMRQWGVTA